MSAARPSEGVARLPAGPPPAEALATSPGISVVIPVYNSERSLPELVSRLETALRATGRPFEAILVNDGSQDGSWAVVRGIASRQPWVRGIDLMRNYGQHNALLCGIRAAAHSVTVTIDDDLQHPPEEIPRLLTRLDAGCDVVYGTPEQEPHGWWRGLASRATKLAIQSAMRVDAARSVSAFRAFRTRLREAFADYQSPFVSIDVLLTWGTARFDAVRVRHEVRRFGPSNYGVASLLVHALNMITGFSVLPLRLASLVGFSFSLLGLVLLAYVVGRYLIQGSIPGFPFLASAISIFSGAQLFALGIVGEYLARMHLRSMGRPYSVTRETVGFADSPAPPPGPPS